MPGHRIPSAHRGVCHVLVHDGRHFVVPQLLGVERSDGGHAGDALPQESGHHGWIINAGVQRAGKMGAGPAHGFVEHSDP